MRKPAFISLVVALAVLLGGVGYWMLFTTFMAHDDEGYVLWSARQFCEGRPLYTEVYSQYGPSFYAWYRGWHVVTGLPFTSESARWLTLGYWLLAAGACGWMVLRLTGQWLAAAAGCLLSFAALQEMIREPFHPGGFLAGLAALGVVLTLRALVREQSRSFMIWGGVIGTIMALTKINVGGFFLVALGSWVWLNLGGRRWGWWALGVVAVGTVTAPWVLMKLRREEEWIQLFITVFTAGGLAMLAQVWAVRRLQFTWRAALWLAGSGTGVALLLALFGSATGTPLQDLIDGVVIAPLRHPGVITYPILWRAGTGECALVALVCSLICLTPWSQRKGRPLLLATLRLVGGGAVLVQLTGLFYDLPFRAVFQFGPALAWLMAAPLRPGSAEASTRGRAWLGWCALWQTLQAFPVAGSQAAWGSFLFVPLLVIGVYEALVYLVEWSPRPQLSTPLAGGALVALGLLAVAQQGSESLVAYQRREPLGLPGAQSLRLARNLSKQARVLSRNVTAHAGLLFTTPGMLSFNLWAQKPTPTAANVTVWGTLLSPGQKHALAQRLVQDRTAMVISRVTGGRVYAPDNFLAPFQPTIHVGDYMLWTWKEATPFPLGTVRQGREVAGLGTLELYVAPHPQAVAAVLVRSSETRRAVAQAIPPARHPWRVVPMSLQSQPLGEPVEMAEPAPLVTTALVEVALPSSIGDLDPDLLEVVLLDSVGAELETLCFNKVPAPSLPLLAPNGSAAAPVR